MLKSRILMLVMVLLLALPFVGVKAQDGTIVEVAAGNPDFSTLVSLVQSAGLTDTLNGEGPFTVFAPTNEAFAALPADVVAYLGAHPDLLTSVLTYHVVPQAIPAADAMAMTEPGEVATVQGENITVQYTGEVVRVNGANVVTADVMASNGVIHAIDEVLIPTITLPEVDPLSLEGDIITAGSSTVFPLSERMAERFGEEGFAGSITVDSIGTGAGFERFCTAAETDISNASRAIKTGADSEAAKCEANGRPAIPFRIGTDALAIVVSTENTFAQNLTKAQLADIYSGKAATWGDVIPEVKGTDDDQPIQLFSPGSDSGTFTYFAEVIFADLDAEQREPTILNAPGIQLSEDDNVLVQGVEGSKYAIGYFGFAYYQENQEKLRAVSVEGVAPTAETAENGEYPLARPLFIYSAKSILAEKPQVAGFINFYLTNVNDEISDVGYFPASSEALNAARLEWLAAVGDAGM